MTRHEELLGTPEGMAVAHAALAISDIYQAQHHELPVAEVEMLYSSAAFHYKTAVHAIDGSVDMIEALAPFLAVFDKIISTDEEKITDLMLFSRETLQRLNKQPPGADREGTSQKLSKGDLCEPIIAEVKDYYIQLEAVYYLAQEEMGMTYCPSGIVQYLDSLALSGQFL